jgi:hypothetical protein
LKLVIFSLLQYSEAAFVSCQEKIISASLKVVLVFTKMRKKLDFTAFILLD